MMFVSLLKLVSHKNGISRGVEAQLRCAVHEYNDVESTFVFEK